MLLQLLQDSPAIKVCVRVRPFIKEEAPGTETSKVRLVKDPLVFGILGKHAAAAKAAQMQKDHRI